MDKKIIGFLNSYTAGVSGGDVRFAEIFRKLPLENKIVITSKLGMQFCISKGVKAKYIETSTEPVFKFKEILFIYFKRLCKTIFKSLYLNEGDILYVGSDIMPDVIPAFFCRLIHRNIIWIQMIFHFIPLPSIRRGGITMGNVLSYVGQRITLQLVKMKADKIITINSLVENDLIKMGIQKEKVYIGSMGVNRYYYDKILPKKEKDYQGVYIGRIHQSKGVFDLVNIWNDVSKVYQDAKLAIIGEGNKLVKENLLQRIKELSLIKNVELLGHMDDVSAYALLKTANIFLFPSYEEGWGLAIAEAMACKVPVIAYDLSVFREIFPKGLVRVPVGNISEFSKKVTELLKDEKMREMVAMEALDNVDLYTWDSASNKEWRIINEIRK